MAPGGGLMPAYGVPVGQVAGAQLPLAFPPLDQMMQQGLVAAARPGRGIRRRIRFWQSGPRNAPSKHFMGVQGQEGDAESEGSAPSVGLATTLSADAPSYVSAPAAYMADAGAWPQPGAAAAPMPVAGSAWGMGGAQRGPRRHSVASNAPWPGFGAGPNAHGSSSPGRRMRRAASESARHGPSNDSAHGYSTATGSARSVASEAGEDSYTRRGRSHRGRGGRRGRGRGGGQRGRQAPAPAGGKRRSPRNPG